MANNISTHIILQVFFNQANMSKAERILIICDRGAMDPSAYLDKESWTKVLEELNLDQFSLREDRYDQVYFKMSAKKVMYF